MRKIICSILVLTSFRALALDAFEIQVYNAEINKPGEASLETHVNNVLKGSAESEGAILPSDKMTHVTFEPAIGITPFWEMGGYFQTARAENNHYYYAGVKWRNKFVVPRETAGNWHIGANFEISNIPGKFEESLFGGEVRTIIGYETEQWLVLINPIFTFAFSTEQHSPEFEPALKAQWNLNEHWGIGPEYYTGMGAVDKIPEWGKQTHILYLAVDLLKSKYEWNVGIGHGLTSSADNWVAKTIFGFTF